MVGVAAHAHQSLLTPILPLFIESQGGTAGLVGLVSAAFSVASFVVRPIAGRVIDSWGARGVLGLSLLASGLWSLGYLVYHVAVLFAVRVFHGLSWAAYVTSGNVALSAIAPRARRGEAVGYYLTAYSVAAAVVPSIAVGLLGALGFGGVFALCAGFALAGAACVLAMPRQPRQAAPARESFWAGLIEPSALLPCVLEILSRMHQPAMLVFIPLYALARGISGEGLASYYLVYGAANLAMRAVFGRWSDRVGRGWTIAAGAVLAASAMVALALATGVAALLAAAVLGACGAAASGPSVMALAIDRAPPERRGAAMGTYSMAFQAAQGIGAILCGYLIELVGYQATFLLAALPPLAALLLLAWRWGEVRGAGQGVA